MDFKQFQELPIAKKLAYQRCLYCVSRTGATEGKVGLAGAGLMRRLSSYLTYYKADGLTVHAVAAIRQPWECTVDVLRKMERFVLAGIPRSALRIPGSETYRDGRKTVEWFCRLLRDHPMTIALWTHQTRAQANAEEGTLCVSADASTPSAHGREDVSDSSCSASSVCVAS